MALTKTDWCFIEKYYPDYTSSYKISQLDILQRYEDEEQVDDIDKEWVQSIGNWRRFKKHLEDEVMAETINSYKNI